jgi:hypothetical protein
MVFSNSRLGKQQGPADQFGGSINGQRLGRNVANQLVYFAMPRA